MDGGKRRGDGFGSVGDIDGRVGDERNGDPIPRLEYRFLTGGRALGN